MKPNFLVIGAAKAATSSLCEALGHHPDVFMSVPKEPNFFSFDAVYARGMSWYEHLFEHAYPCSAIGEGSTSYSLCGIFPHTVARICDILGTPKIIYCVREPYARVESGWKQARQSAHPSALASFNRSIRESPNFLDESLYWKQINAYRAHIPDARILVIFFEAFTTDTQATLRRCFEFLEVDPDVTIANADRPLAASADYRQDGVLAAALRRLPHVDRLAAAIPQHLRRAVLRMLRAPLDPRPQWDAATRAWYSDQVRDDLRTFLSFYGKPPHYWPLDGDSNAINTGER